MNSQQPTQYNFKVVLLGEGCVGKTSIVLRYVEDKFNPQHISTLQASFLTKKVTLENGNKVQLNIWDTAGQERFHALGPIYYRGSHGAILVYDITDQDSFQKVKNWVKELKRMLGSEIILAIAGNKIDLEEQRTVMEEDAMSYAESVGAHYFETSAKTNDNVEEVFVELTRLMVQHAQQNNQKQRTMTQQQFGQRRLIVEDSTEGNDERNKKNKEKLTIVVETKENIIILFIPFNIKRNLNMPSYDSTILVGDNV